MQSKTNPLAASNAPSTARLATISRLIETTLPAYLDPIPCRVTLRAMFDQAGVPRLKASPHAKRGGGNVYYSVSHVEKLLRSRLLPGRLQAQEAVR